MSNQDCHGIVNAHPNVFSENFLEKVTKFGHNWITNTLPLTVKIGWIIFNGKHDPSRLWYHSSLMFQLLNEAELRELTTVVEKSALSRQKIWNRRIKLMLRRKVNLVLHLPLQHWNTMMLRHEVRSYWINTTLYDLAVIANVHSQSLLENAKCVLCGFLGEFRELKLSQRKHRGQRLVKIESIFYLRISQLSGSVQRADWSQKLLKLDMPWQKCNAKN